MTDLLNFMPNYLLLPPCDTKDGGNNDNKDDDLIPKDQESFSVVELKEVLQKIRKNDKDKITGLEKNVSDLKSEEGRAKKLKEDLDLSKSEGQKHKDDLEKIQKEIEGKGDFEKLYNEKTEEIKKTEDKYKDLETKYNTNKGVMEKYNEEFADNNKKKVEDLEKLIPNEFKPNFEIIKSDVLSETDIPTQNKKVAELIKNSNAFWIKKKDDPKFPGTGGGKIEEEEAEIKEKFAKAKKNSDYNFNDRIKN